MQTDALPAADALRIGFRKDPLDAFLLYGLATKTASVPDDPAFTLDAYDAATLHAQASQGVLDVARLSVPAFAHLMTDYIPLSQGAIFGEGYGAMVVMANPLQAAELGRLRIAVPDTSSTGFLALSLFLPQSFDYVVMPDTQILNAVADGSVEAGLLTGHEQLTHQGRGVYNILDLGAWWQEQTGLPFPLELLAIRRSLSPVLQQRALQAVQGSVQTALPPTQAAMLYALAYAPEMDKPTGETYIEMYITARTQHLDEIGRRSLQTFLDMCAQRHLLPAVSTLDWL